MKEEKTRCVIALVDLARLAARSDAMAREAEAIAVRRAREATTSLAYPIGTAREAFLCDFDFVRFRFRFRLVSSGPFYTSESRGGVERRQLELKGAEGGY